MMMNAVTIDFEMLLKIATGIFAIFLFLSMLDGVYLHLIRYRLPENLGSRFEHRLHSLRSILFIPTVYLLFYRNISGKWLWIAVVLVLIDFYFQAVDILEERLSRLRIGGLRSGEYLLHVFESTLHLLAIALVLVCKPQEAWSRAVELPEYPESVRLCGLLFIGGGLAVAALHVVLIPYPFLVTKVLGMTGRSKWR